MNGEGAKTTSAKRTRLLPEDRHRAILQVAAKVICERGYDGASIQEIADACELTKAGLYHYIGSKENLLAEIMAYGMDLFEAQVLAEVKDIDDPVLRLRRTMEQNIKLVTRGSSKHITIILHEHATLTGGARKTIDARKKKYVRFLEQSFAEAVTKGLIRPVSPKVAAFSFLGMVLWTYKWFRPDGELSDDQIADAMIDLLFTGLEPATPPRAAGETR